MCLTEKYLHLQLYLIKWLMDVFIYSFIHLLLFPTCGMSLPYLILEGSSIGSSILLSQIPNESQVTGRTLMSPSNPTDPLPRRTPTIPNNAPPIYRTIIQDKVRLNF